MTMRLTNDYTLVAACMLVATVAAHSAAQRDEDQMFGYFTGQHDALKQVFGDAHDWRFTEDFTAVEAARESLTNLKPEALNRYWEQAIRRVNAAEYVRLHDGYGDGYLWPTEKPAPQKFTIDMDAEDVVGQRPEDVPEADFAGVISGIASSRALGSVGANVVVDREGGKVTYAARRQGQAATYVVTVEESK